MQYGKSLHSSEYLIRYRRSLDPNIPSTPVTPRPSTMFCVNLKGTRSGVSRVLPYGSQRQFPSEFLTGFVRQMFVNLFKQAVEVYVHYVSGVSVQQNVLAMPVTKAIIKILSISVTEVEYMHTQE